MHDVNSSVNHNHNVVSATIEPNDGFSVPMGAVPCESKQAASKRDASEFTLQVSLPKVARISDGVSISECLCVELCCGSAKLSRALKNLGFAGIPVDWGKNRHASCVRFVSLDLTSPSAYVLFQQLIDSGRLCYVHAAPPCGTGSRAREKPISRELRLQGAPEPKPLRSEQWPAGLPTLTGTDKLRVEAANLIYAFVAWAISKCLDLLILASCENPRNAYIWFLKEWVVLLADPRLEINDHQVCMFGGRRDKWSRWVATKQLFTSMRVACDGKHKHAPWGFSAPQLSAGWNFATAEEAEYPDDLCCRAAQLVHSRVVEGGAVPVPGALSDPGLTDKQAKHLNRASTGKLPRGRTLPQLVSEFRCVSEQLDYVPNDATKLLRQFYKGGADGLQQVKVSIVGHLREPGEFLQCAMDCSHPVDILHNVDDVTKRALFKMLVIGPSELAEERKQYLVKLTARALELDAQEKLLHDGMPEHIRKIMVGKRLLLLKEVMSQSGCKDVGLHDLLAFGTRLTGLASASGELFKRVKPAEITEQDLKDQAQWHRDADNLQQRPADNAETVRSQTYEEVTLGWLGGPNTSGELDACYGKWVSHHRFGIDQNGKTRVIDDCKRGGINLALCTVEKLDLMDVDRLAEVLLEILRAVRSGGIVLITLSTGELLQGFVHAEWEHSPGDGGIDILGRLLDLKSAYKQLGVHEESLWASNVHLDSIDGGAPQYFKSYALLFGSTASVYSFNRLARALWRCMSVQMHLLMTQFYDDFPQLEPRQTAESARHSATQFLDVLGILWSTGEKDLPFSHTFQPLGVQIDLSAMASRGEVIISNKPSRVSSISQQLLDVKRCNSLVPALASEIHGKLHFTEAQVFGRAALPAIREISSRANERGRPFGLTPRLVRAIDFVIDHLRTAKPRKLTACDLSRNLLVFTDGAFEQEKAEWGFFVHDCADDRRLVSGGVVPQSLADFWLSTVGDQIITQVELFAALAARIYLGERCAGRKVIYWIDNDPARDSLIRGFSPSLASLSVIYQFFEQERLWPSYVWFARVPSHSNIADGPSRGRAREVACEMSAELVSAHMPADAVKGLMEFRLSQNAD